jgi:tyrosine-protein kinase Etk/Wzc
MGTALAPLTPAQPPAPPSAAHAAEASNRQFWSLVSRNRFLIIAALVITPVLSGLAASLVTPVYEGTATVAIEKKPTPVPSLAEGGLVSDKVDVAAEIELLGSRTMAEATADSLALHVVLTHKFRLFSDGHLISPPHPVSRTLVFGGLLAPRTARPGAWRMVPAPGGGYVVRDRATDSVVARLAPGQTGAIADLRVVLADSAAQQGELYLDVLPFSDAVGALRGALEVRRPSRDVNTIAVTYQSADPALVRDVPNALLTQFVAVRRDISKTEARSTVRFLRQQLDTIGNQLAASEERLVAFRARNQGVLQRPTQTVRADRDEGRLAQDRADRQLELQSLQQVLADVGVAARTRSPDSTSAYFRLMAFPRLLTSIQPRLQALSEAEQQRAQLLVRRTRDNPEVVALTVRAREIEQQVDYLARRYLSDLSSQLRNIDSTLSVTGRQSAQAPVAELDLARLERQAKANEALFNMVQARLKEAEIAQAVDDARIRILDPAELGVFPVKPDKGRYLKLALFVGLALGLALAFLREMLDSTVHINEDMAGIVGANALGLIPHIRSSQTTDLRYVAATMIPGVNPDGSRDSAQFRQDRIISAADPGNPIVEAYRTLRTNLTFARPDPGPKAVVFTSPSPRDGKTTTASNLAIVLAYQRLKVLLIDADMRRGSVHKVFELEQTPGLSNLLIGGTRASECIRRIELGEDHSLDVICAGDFPPNPAELLGSERMHQLIQEFERWYDFVIFDSPPLNLVTDAALLGAKAGGIVIVARANHTERAAVHFAVEQLRAVRAPVLGFVLNDFVFQRDYRTRGGAGYDYYGYRGAAYAERYGEGYGENGGNGSGSGWAGRIRQILRK